ncbi:MAG: transglutaminase family protein [Verrucomicrobiales bacterium]|nr:transglutaminase family protein [Verrucomicrobiales bacterium]
MISLKPTRSLLLAPALLGLILGLTSRADTLFDVRQSFAVTNVPSNASRVRAWLWMPEDRPEQKVIDFRIVSGPETLRITRDPKYGRSWIYADIPADRGPLRVVTEFKLLRKKIEGMARADEAKPLSEEGRRAFAAELRRDEMHMEVSPKIEQIARELAAGEKNPVLLAKRYFDYVIQKSEHYSKHGKVPLGKCLGSAEECLAGTGDCCTDQHALFIALCRSQNIPCRLMYGSRLRPDNAGKDHDPGYRCWPNFFATGLGWVPLDISSADTANSNPDAWFGGLDENRAEWAEGRDFDLEPRSDVRPDLVIRGWVEVDGKPFSGLQRTLHFTASPK